MDDWRPDELGDGYEQRTIALGQDPDGEGEVEATLVRREPAESFDRAVIYVHGFSDYFFQSELADHFTDRGFAFYALDLRKCGRSRRDGQTGHYVSDLGLYDLELEQALQIVRAETGKPVVLMAHSTGGLIVSLWLDRLNGREGGTRAAGIEGLILNSPWFDLQGPPWARGIGTKVIAAVARVRPTTSIKLPHTDAYGSSLHVSGHGEWDFNTMLKPLEGFPVSYGWLTAIRRGHKRLQRGLDVGVPSLVLRSTKTRFARSYSPEVDEADAVLDVKQIARWAGCLGNAVSVVPVDGARHDVFISKPAARKAAYEAVDAWLRAHDLLVEASSPTRRRAR